MPKSDLSTSDLRIGSPNRISNERTNERTDVNSQDADRSGSFAERVRAYEPVVISEVLEADTLAPLARRHEVIRTGERDEIPAHVRTAVFLRDRGKCQWCGHQVDGPWHLDHITPWSAGGSDTTPNLRVLCERHNVERSNYVDHERQRMAATWWCTRCYSNEGFQWSYFSHMPSCGIHYGADPAYPLSCPVARGYRRWHELHGEYPTWHEVPPITDDEPLVTAWCAHCYSPGQTSRPL